MDTGENTPESGKIGGTLYRWRPCDQWAGKTYRGMLRPRLRLERTAIDVDGAATRCKKDWYAKTLRIVLI